MIFGKKEDPIRDQMNFEREMQGKDLTAQDSRVEEAAFTQGIQDPNLTQWQQDIEPELEKMFHMMKGEVETEPGQWKPTGFGSLCTEKTIYRILAYSRHNISQNLMLSKLDEAVISQRMIGLENGLILDVLLPENMENNTPLTSLSQIKQIFRSIVHPTFHRARGGFESNNQKMIRTVKELHGDIQPEKKKSKSMFGF